jgi:outer membrane lipoprotein-sorting protein
VSRSRLVALVIAALTLGACATVPTRVPLPAEVEAGRLALERRLQTFRDLRSLANIDIRRVSRRERLAGVLLLRAPGSLRFEALSPFGPPILLVGAGSDGVTVWEVLKNRAYLLPSSPEANRQWLGLAVSVEDLVAFLSGHARPMAEPVSGALLPPDDNGPSISLRGADASQRIWFDPETAQVKQVEWTGGKSPLRVTFAGGSPTEPPAAITLTTLDGRLEVRVRYQQPRLNEGVDADLIRVSVPQGVEIQDFR